MSKETKEPKPKAPAKSKSKAASKVTKAKKNTAKATTTAPSLSRRNRVPISCTICRRRKVKCDKRRPVCSSCEHNGVPHLCHYVDPSWAQPLDVHELTHTHTPAAEILAAADDESVEKLRERIKYLENQLNAYNGTISPGTISESSHDSKATITGSSSSSDGKSPYENLNLSKKFDMLHIKTTTTVHLGATSWLAIMKGDPYLRVLWAHIFKLRKQAEENKFRKKMEEKEKNAQTPSISYSDKSEEPMKLPIRHLNSDIASPGVRSPSVGTTCPVSGKDISRGKCPVIHASGKCPVDYDPEEDKQPQTPINVRDSVEPTPGPSTISTPSVDPLRSLLHPSESKTESNGSSTSSKTTSLPTPVTDLYDPATCPVSGKDSNQGKCPVAHDLQDEQLKKEKRKLEEDEINIEEEEAKANKMDDRVCPLMIGDNSFLENLSSDKPTNENTNKPKNTPSDNTISSAKISPASTSQSTSENTKPEEPTTKRRKKNSRSNSNPRKNSEKNKKVTPEDFKQNPVAMMQRFLPRKAALWALIDRFFEVLYVYMPFVDEESFREEAKFIFGERTDKEQKVTIRIRSGVDFALVGTVCIILRLTWNTLPKNNIHAILKQNNNIKNYQEDKEVIKFLQKDENEVPIELVDCVKHCFSNLKLMRKSSLKIVQCALYMKLYFVFSPQDGDGADGSDSQIFLGMIIQMAISIGLHRDPKNFENFANERQRHLWRKIWYELVSLDIHQSMNLGCPRSLQNYEEFSDTRLPGDTEDGLDLEEFKDDIKELTVIKNLTTEFKVDLLISKTMNILLNINNPATRSQVDGLISELSKSINGFSNDKHSLQQLGKILVYRSKTETLVASATRAIEFRLHVMVNMMIYLLNYILFVHFEPKGAQDPLASQIAKNYAQRALDCALDGYRNCSLFFDAGLEYFGPGVDLVLSPLLLMIGHRSIQFMVSLILRSRCGPFMKPAFIDNPDKSNINPKSTAGVLDPKNGFHNIDNKNHDLNGVSIIDNTEQFRSVFNVDVNSGEILATILLEHMDSFYKLADILGKKYPYSWRMSKAVGFFITLLKKPINVVKSMVKTDNVRNVENNVGSISAVLNSVPLVLSTDEEQLKRCPVFMNRTEVIPQQSSSTTGTPVNTPNSFLPPTNFPQNLAGLNSNGNSGGLSMDSTSQFRIPGNSPFGLHSTTQDFPTPPVNYSGTVQGSSSSDYTTPTPVPTPSPFPNSFSLAFSQDNNIYESISNNPINMVDVDGGEQLPELVQASESFTDFNDPDRSFSDIFGVLPNVTEDNGGTNGLGGLNADGLDLASTAGGDIPGIDFNAMMGGSWFS